MIKLGFMPAVKAKGKTDAQREVAAVVTIMSKHMGIGPFAMAAKIRSRLRQMHNARNICSPVTPAQMRAIRGG